MAFCPKLPLEIIGECLKFLSDLEFLRIIRISHVTFQAYREELVQRIKLSPDYRFLGVSATIMQELKYLRPALHMLFQSYRNDLGRGKRQFLRALLPLAIKPKLLNELLVGELQRLGPMLLYKLGKLQQWDLLCSYLRAYMSCDPEGLVVSKLPPVFYSPLEVLGAMIHGLMPWDQLRPLIEEMKLEAHELQSLSELMTTGQWPQFVHYPEHLIYGCQYLPWDQVRPLLEVVLKLRGGINMKRIARVLAEREGATVTSYFLREYKPMHIIAC